MTDPMSDEFDAVAAWTADAAVSLGASYYIPAGCRGSGSPAALSWLVDALALTSSDRLLDVGAGVGGPAAFAAQSSGARPVLAEPEPGACRAARRLFGFPTVRAAAEALPFASGSFDVAWCLGVLCTTDDQPGVLAELRRVLAAGGHLGLLVFTVDRASNRPHPTGNHFPTAPALRTMLRDARFDIAASKEMSAFGPEPAGWRRQVDMVDAELDRRHHDDEPWQIAQRQSSTIGRLLEVGELTGSVFDLRA